MRERHRTRQSFWVRPDMFGQLGALANAHYAPAQAMRLRRWSGQSGKGRVPNLRSRTLSLIIKEIDMPDGKLGKVPMPASGQNSPKLHSDGVSNVDTHGCNGSGESGGGAYPNPHTGKEERGEGGGFEGGQSVKGYYGSGVLDGKEAASRPSEPVDKGKGGSG